MGHGPSLSHTIANSEQAKAAVEKAIQKAEIQLANTQKKGIAYINEQTNGIIGKGVLFSNNNSYSKFSDSYSLSALDSIVDNVITAAQDYLNPENDEMKAAKLAGAVGNVVKSTLALFATNSSTNTELQVIFSQIIAGDANYAVYYATNSMTVNAQNAWGNKNITVVSNLYLFAQIEPNVQATYAEILQQNLYALARLNGEYDAALGRQSLDSKEYCKLMKYQGILQTEMSHLQAEIDKELQTEDAK